MRYRGAGKIGAFDDNVPQKNASPKRNAAKGCWKLGEACQWLSVDRWPRRLISIEAMPEYVDTTVGHYGEIKPTITTQYEGEFKSVRWQYSDNGGTTWFEKPSDTNHVIDTEDDGLLLSNQWRNLDASGNDVNGGLPVDGRLWRVIVTCGLRSQRSDYFDEAEQKWKGRCEEWNDRVIVSFTNHPDSPTGVVRVGDEVEFQATAVATGQDHGQSYQVTYRWQVSEDGVNYALLPEADYSSSTVNFVPISSGSTYLRAKATFTYSDPPDHIVTGRPDVVAYSDSAFINVQPAI